MRSVNSNATAELISVKGASGAAKFGKYRVRSAWATQDQSEKATQTGSTNRAVVLRGHLRRCLQ